MSFREGAPPQSNSGSRDWELPKNAAVNKLEWKLGFISSVIAQAENQDGSENFYFDYVRRGSFEAYQPCLP